MAVVCEICGNDILRQRSCCPYCGSTVEQEIAAKKIFRHRVINLEEGRPLLEAALKKMELGIIDSSRQGFVALTLIHGYGSSGRGGVIRTECRKMLDHMTASGAIAGYLAGEQFSSRYPPAKQWLRRFPSLANNSYLNRGNRGITVVFLY